MLPWSRLCSSGWNNNAAGIHKCLGKINCFFHYVYIVSETMCLRGSSMSKFYLVLCRHHVDVLWFYSLVASFAWSFLRLSKLNPRPILSTSTQVIITSHGFLDYLQPLLNLQIWGFYSLHLRLDHIFCIGSHSLGRCICQFIIKAIAKDTDGQPDGEVHRVRWGKVPSIALLFPGN